MSARNALARFGNEAGAVLLRYYVMPVLIGCLLAFLLATWVFMLVGVSIWTVALLASFSASFGTVLIEEVMAG